MSDISEIAKIASENGAFGWIIFGGFLVWFVLEKKVFITQEMAILRESKAALEVRVEMLEKHIETLEKRLNDIEGAV